MIGILILLLAVATLLAGWTLKSTDQPSPKPAPVSQGEQAARDRLARAAMPWLPSADALPLPLSTGDLGPQLTLPPSSGSGPSDVPSGFPHSALGAMAQLSAIDGVAMRSGTLDGVRKVIRSWALPGGPTPSTWSLVTAMASMLSDLGLSAAGSPGLSVHVRPAMGLIKGTVGANFVIPCIDFEFDISLDEASATRAAAADCQRMVWVSGRWVIGSGPEPAQAPSVWPDTDTAFSVGYRDLR